MPKISIVLSAILVVSGISADNPNISPRDECIQGIKQMETYITETLDKTPDSERKTEMALQMQQYFDNMTKKKNTTVDQVPDDEEYLVDYVKLPNGDRINCTILRIVEPLYEKSKDVDQLYKKSAE